MEKARSYKDLFMTGDGELQKLHDDINTLTKRRAARQRLQEALVAIFGCDALLAMSKKEVAAKLGALPKTRCAYCIQLRPMLVYSNGLKIVLCNACQRADSADSPEAKAPGTPVMSVR